MDFLSSTGWALFLIILFFPFLIIAFLIPQGFEPSFYIKALGEKKFSLLNKWGFTDIFHTTSFYLLSIFFFLSLILCSVKNLAIKKEMKRFPSFFAHIFLSLLMLSLAQSSFFSSEKEIILKQNEKVEIFYPFSSSWAGKILKKKNLNLEDKGAGLFILLRDFIEERECWRGINAIKNWRAILEFHGEKGIERKITEVNSPAQKGNLKFYLLGFEAKAIFESEGNFFSMGENESGEFRLKKIHLGGLPCRNFNFPVVEIETDENPLYVMKGQSFMLNDKKFTFREVSPSLYLNYKYDPAIPFVKFFSFSSVFLFLFSYIVRKIKG